MAYSDKELAALEYHERLHALYAAMDAKKRSATLIKQEESRMTREQFISTFKHYASLSAAAGFDALRRLFTWAAKRCDDANTYFLSISARHRR